MANETTSQPAGPAADAQGRASVDPTKNVMALVAAEGKRQDGLRKMQAYYIEREMDTAVKHSKIIRKLESSRLKAIREVDVKAVADAAATAATTAATLAAQVATTAEAQRVATADVAIAVEAKIRSEVDPLKKDIGELRQSQYEGLGAKAQVGEAREATADNKPILDAIAKLTDAQAQSVGAKGKVVETRASQGLMLTVVGLVLLVLFQSLGMILFVVFRGA